MTISSVLNNAFTALQLNQEGLRVTSNNVANVNTPNYARRAVEQQPATIQGLPAGVEIAQIRRIVDSFFIRESLNASSSASQFETEARFHDQLQSLFGSPDQNSSLSGQIDRVTNSLAQLSLDVTSAARRADALSSLKLLTGGFSDLADQIQSIRTDIDREIAFQVNTLNSLFERVYELNGKIARELVLGDTPAALQDQRDALVAQIAELIDVTTNEQPNGELYISTKDGFSLVSAMVVRLDYISQNVMSTDTVPQFIQASSINPQTNQTVGTPLALDSHIASGKVRGLLNMRDDVLPSLASEVGQLAAGVADRLNAAHNDNAAVPAPNSLVGRNTGLVATDSANFTGKTTLAVTSSNGTLVTRIDFDFTAGTYSVDGGAAVAIGGGTIGDIVAAMNTALGANGSASFAGGVLSVQAANGSDGVAFLQDSTDPSSRAGRGFSHFFGLNDLITARRPSTFETGISGTDAHGFTPGQTIDFVVRHPDGREAVQFTYTVAGATFDDILADLNNPVTGLGAFMSFTLDANGKITATPQPDFSGFQLMVVSDSTSRSGSGVAFTELFGLGTRYQMEQARDMAVAARITANPDLLALAKLDLSTGTPGALVLSPGDNRGAMGLEIVGSTSLTFDPAGKLGAATATLNEYAALILADMGTQAAHVESRRDDSLALREEVDQRKQAVQGVNMDEELANMMVYQQSYNAAARMVTTVRELFDTLLSMVR